MQETPFFELNEKHLESKIKKIKENFDFAEIYYAMKANNHPFVLKKMKEQSLGFEIASYGEFLQLCEIGVRPENMICSNPVKPIRFIKESYKLGLRYFAFDSYSELEKFEKFAPEACLYVRLSVDNTTSDYPLSGKFGVTPQKAVDLIRLAKKKGLNVCGINFHVGSQCRNVNSWEEALVKVRHLLDQLALHNISIDFIDLGGGLPVNYGENILSIDAFALAIKGYIDKHIKPYNVRLFIEPGRAFVADSIDAVASVIGVRENHNSNIVTLDIGVFSGLIEMAQGFHYQIETDSKNPKKIYTLYGPSCDSMDKLFEKVSLNEVKVGDKIRILNAGAYSIVYASEFNGFPVPKLVVI